MSNNYNPNVASGSSDFSIYSQEKNINNKKKNINFKFYNKKFRSNGLVFFIHHL